MQTVAHQCPCAGLSWGPWLVEQHVRVGRGAFPAHFHHPQELFSYLCANASKMGAFYPQNFTFVNPNFRLCHFRLL